MELSGKVALVTGAARRVGRVIALGLAQAGADVALHYHSSHDDACSAADKIRALGRRAEIFRADLASPVEIESLLSAVGTAFGRLDVLVNSAGVYHRTPIDALSAEQMDAAYALNARAPALCVRHALPLMQPGACVVNITDSPAGRGMGGFPAYCASKGALDALTASMSRALAHRGIRVNAVAPGVVQWHEGAAEQVMAKVLAAIPMQCTGTPQDVAAAVVFLAQADYVTGQTLRVDGGWCMG